MNMQFNPPALHAPIQKTKSYQKKSPIAVPDGFMLYEDFVQKFTLGTITTEQLHPTTLRLSQTMHQNLEEGMGLLLDVDQKVLEGFKAFAPLIDQYASDISANLQKGGRVFLVGSGSSGRVGLDLAAKCNKVFPEDKGKVIGIIAGGDSALIRSKEGFEDSLLSGEEALSCLNPGPYDTVILISASGSAYFNAGAAQYAANKNAHVYYFYNSTHVPHRTEQLFSRTNNPVIPLCLDIGPQAIAGSTRLQGASIAEACLGSILSSALNKKNNSEKTTDFNECLQRNMETILSTLRSHLKPIGEFALAEQKVFLNPDANFRKVQDVSEQGYVTFFAEEDSIREVLIDSTETPPTFCTKPPRRENEPSRKRAEFRTYLIEKKENFSAWQALMGREISSKDLKDTQDFLLSAETLGLNSYQNRPLGKGNLSIGVLKVTDPSQISPDLLKKIKTSHDLGGDTGLILLCRGSINKDIRSKLKESVNHLLVLENIPSDEMGLSETLLLKQLLNLISNSSMILMNKVSGNLMIDMKASNNKLIDRSIRLVKRVAQDYNFDCPLSDKELYHKVIGITALSKAYAEKGRYVPSVVKMTVAMMVMEKTLQDFNEVATYLLRHNEGLEGLQKDSP